MMQILEELTPLSRVICSTDFDCTVSRVAELLPCRILEFPATGPEHNGWVIPPKWDVVSATIKRGDELVYDGTWHPLGVIALSAPFEGTVSLDELRAHLHYDHRYDDSLTFHFRGLFRSWERDWGFCVPKDLYDSFEPGEYDVKIVTREEPGVLKVAVSRHEGTSPYTVALCANLDHPGVANDGLAGVVVGIEVIRRLAGRRTKFGYELVLAPGIMGTEYYLGTVPPDHPLRHPRVHLPLDARLAHRAGAPGVARRAHRHRTCARPGDARRRHPVPPRRVRDGDDQR